MNTKLPMHYFPPFDNDYNIILHGFDDCNIGAPIAAEYHEMSNNAAQAIMCVMIISGW